MRRFIKVHVPRSMTNELLPRLINIDHIVMIGPKGVTPFAEPQPGTSFIRLDDQYLDEDENLYVAETVDEIVSLINAVED